MRFPTNIYLGERASTLNIISTKRKRYFPYRICSNFFQDNLIFGEATSSHFFRVTTSTNSYFFGATISSEQLLFLRSYFSRTIPSLRQLLFSEQLPFQSKTSTEQPVLENNQFFRTVTLCRNSYFFMKELVQNKDIYRIVTFLKQILLHSNDFFRTDIFSTKVLFQKRYFFTRRNNTCIIIVLLLVQYFISMFSRTVTFWKKLVFQKSIIPHYLLFLESTFSELRKI